ncbi:MAG: L,D-transpeptidase family protein [Gammaproteobacteria bacterium]|nr:L,D-transpeptidase family protein [Gammaproteobacteria bacterium]MDP6617184.1 L,D-transpeptidase family protein [Gammaproteobacteria bacterium]MDP6695393.1 L,D-transpeptidase family protein [Gammaproteobacteria bacterium]
MSARQTRLIVSLLFLLVPVWQPLWADSGLADHVLVKKSKRKLYLIRDEEILREFDIALGLMPEGHKLQEGDFRTPEGSYKLTNRRIDSDFFMSIQVSYPSAEDVEVAKALKVKPGSYIMIHGQPGNPKKPADYYASYDWTDGCIAVSNAAMVDIWQLTKVNTPITITP